MYSVVTVYSKNITFYATAINIAHCWDFTEIDSRIEHAQTLAVTPTAI